MKVLILGGTGLISTAITSELLARGFDVTHYNRGKSQARFEGPVKRIQGDRRDFAAFEAQMAEAGRFDAVIDMICYRPEEAESDIRAFAGKTGQLIFCSTVDVYSKPPQRFPVVEDESRNARSEYGQNKVRCEDLFLQAHQRGELPVTIIRPAHTYGEGGVLIHTFGWTTPYLDRIRKGKPIVSHGDGSALWVACHIDDVGHAFVEAIGNQRALGKAYHTTGEEWMTWDGYYQRVAQAMGAPEPQIVHIPTDFLYEVAPERTQVVKDNFQYTNVFDNSAAKRDLDFRYTIPFVEGARRTIAWLDANNAIQDSDSDPFDDQLIAAWQEMAGQVKLSLSGL